MDENPWYEISASDYVSHMSDSHVLQYQMINRCFEEALRKYHPATLLVPGCTVGNGFEHISWKNMEKVVALDINPFYLKILDDKFGRYSSLEIVCRDFTEYENPGMQFDLIFAALLFEYLEPGQALQKIASLMHADSLLIVILQQPSKNHGKVSKTPYASLEKLSTLMKLVDISAFYQSLKKYGMKVRSDSTEVLDSGKTFGIFEIGLG